MFSLDQFIVWILIGLIAGSLAGRLIKWERGGFGVWRNMALGLPGAIVGGLLFRLLGLVPSLDKFSISLRDIVAALVGSLIVLMMLWTWRRMKSDGTSAPIARS